MKRTYYIGLDVHRESGAIAYTTGGNRQVPVYFGECGGSNLSIDCALRKLAAKLGVRLRDLKVCHEAGPTGFVLARLEAGDTTTHFHHDTRQIAAEGSR